MKKYHFRLETLQKVRERQLEQQRLQLADAYRAEEILKMHVRELSHELADLHQDRQAATAGRYLDINRLAAAGRYEPVLRARESTLLAQMQLLRQEIDRRRQALLVAERNVRVLKLLDDRRREEHHQQQRREEAKQLDEVASTQYVLRGRQ